MDIASLLGLIGALGFIIYAMVSGGGVGPFIDVPSLAIVFGGTFLCDVHVPLAYVSWVFWCYGKGILSTCEASR